MSEQTINKSKIIFFSIFVVSVLVFSHNLYMHPVNEDNLAKDDQLVAVDKLLNGLHKDAHEGNFQAYFSRYSRDAIFLGTDKSERWTIEEFKNYAKPAFEDGHGWTYQVVERNWEGGGDTRWFDEILFNDKLGYCRGTGVVNFVNNEWKISHYALTMLVPNSIAEEIGSRTKEVDNK